MEVDQVLLAEICALLAFAKFALDRGDVEQAKDAVGASYRELSNLLGPVLD